MWEREKAYVAGSIHVPLFVEDEATDPMTLLKKQIQFGFGGAWLGQRFTKQNISFVAQVEEALPSKKDKIMVACGEGMRLVTPAFWSVFLAFVNSFASLTYISGVCAKQVHDGNRGAKGSRIWRTGLARGWFQQCARR